MAIDTFVDAEFDDVDWDGDESWSEDPDEDLDAEYFELAEVLHDALDDAYADADPEDIDNALAEVLDSMSSAEAFNFAKALKQVGRTASKVVSDPIFKQVVGTGLPIATGALGTLIGGPVGTALGSSLGSAAAGAITGGRRPAGRALPGLAQAIPGLAQAIPGLAKAVPGLAQALPAAAGGSAAAAQGLVLTQQPDVLKSLLALSMGQHGKKAVSGVPVAQVMNMLSSVFGQAAADADELMYLNESENYPDAEEFSYQAEADDSLTGRELYAELLDADNAELDEALESM
jgi:hypothetical protein